MKLDHRSHIFQNLNGASGKLFCVFIGTSLLLSITTDEVELNFLDNETVAYNSLYDTSAVVYHGNGPSKVVVVLFVKLGVNLNFLR